jgi:flavin-dependent thymidylate synthase
MDIAVRAGMSTGKESPADLEKLIRKLVKARHSKPFERVHFDFTITGLPITIDRQMQTHRMQEGSVASSGRYGSTPMEFEKPWDRVNGWMEDGDDYIWHVIEDDRARLNYIITEAADLYTELTKKYSGRGVPMKRCREVFRNILPQGQLMNRSFTMNLVSFANFMRLRLDRKHAQPEIADIAEEMLNAVLSSEGDCPHIALAALAEEGWIL